MYVRPTKKKMVARKGKKKARGHVRRRTRETYWYARAHTAGAIACPLEKKKNTMLAAQKLGELQTALAALGRKRAEVAAESKTEKKTVKRHPLETLQQAAQTLEEARTRPDFATRVNVYWDAFMDDLEDKVLGSEEQSKALLDTYGRRLKTVLAVVDDIDKAIKHDFDVEGNCVAPVNTKTLGVTMASVKGLDPVKKKLEQQFVLPLKYPGLFGAARGGILFYGPPGNGKSMLAKATAAQLGEDTLFYAVDPGQIKGSYEGQTEKNITRVFRCADRAVKASMSKPGTGGGIGGGGGVGGGARRAILFFDEADALFGARGSGGEVNASNVRSVNSFLQAMDGIKATPTGPPPIYSVASTTPSCGGSPRAS